MNAQVPTSSRKAFGNLLTAQVVPLLASVLTTFFTASVLGVDERGTLALIVSTGSLIGAVGYLSIQVGVVKGFRLGDSSSPRRGAFFTFWVGLGIVVVASGAVLLWPALQFGAFNPQVIWMAAVGGGLAAWNLGVLRIRQGLGESRLFRDAWLIQSLTYLIAGVTVAYVTRSSIPTAACWMGALLLSTFWVLAHGKRRSSRATGSMGAVGGAPKRVPMSQILGDSFAAHVALVGQQVMHSGDVVILGMFASAADVGLYSVAVPIAGFVWTLSEALSLLAFQMSSTSDGHRTAQRKRLGRVNIVMGAIAAVFIAAAALFLLPLLLPKYSGAALLVLLLLPGVVIQGYARIALSSVLSVASRARLVVVGMISAGLAVFYVPAVVLYGAIGAAIASTLVYCLQTGFVLIAVRRVEAIRLASERESTI